MTWTRQRLPGHESRPQCYIVTVCKLITKAESANFTLSEAVIPRAHKKAKLHQQRCYLANWLWHCTWIKGCQMACLMLLMTRRANMRNFLRPMCTEPTSSIGAVAWEGVAPPCPIPHQAAQLQMFAIKKRLQPTSSTSWEVPNNRCSPAHRVPGLRTLHEADMPPSSPAKRGHQVGAIRPQGAPSVARHFAPRRSRPLSNHFMPSTCR